MKKHWIPCGLSLSRLVFAPLVVYYFYQGNFELGLILYLIAAFTDGLDGLMARLLKAQTRIGAFLDQACDKVLNISALITLGLILSLHPLAASMVWLIVFIDIFLLAASMVWLIVVIDVFLFLVRLQGFKKAASSYNPAAVFSGKAKMACQISFVSLLAFIQTSWFITAVRFSFKNHLIELFVFSYSYLMVFSGVGAVIFGLLSFWFQLKKVVNTQQVKVALLFVIFAWNFAAALSFAQEFLPKLSDYVLTAQKFCDADKDGRPDIEMRYYAKPDFNEKFNKFLREGLTTLRGMEWDNIYIAKKLSNGVEFLEWIYGPDTGKDSHRYAVRHKPDGEWTPLGTNYEEGDKKFKEIFIAREIDSMRNCK